VGREACILKSIEGKREACIKSIEWRRGTHACMLTSIEGRRKACIKTIERIEKVNIGCLTTQNVET
jgi:hypothetical protein